MRLLYNRVEPKIDQGEQLRLELMIKWEHLQLCGASA